MNIYPANILKQNFNEAISINEKKKTKKTKNKNNFFNNSKPRMMTLYFSKKVSAILSRIT